MQTLALNARPADPQYRLYEKDGERAYIRTVDQAPYQIWVWRYTGPNRCVVTRHLKSWKRKHGWKLVGGQ